MNKINKIIHKIKSDPDKYLLMGLVFVLPFDRIPSLDLMGITLRFSLLFSGLIILRAAYLVFIKKTKLHLFAPQKILVFLLVWIFLLIPESINLKRGFMVAAFDAFSILTAFSVSLIFDSKYIKPIIKTLLASAFVVVIFGIYQYPADLLGVKPAYTGLLERYRYPIFGFPRIQAFSYEPLYFAAYLMLPISTVVAFIVFDDKNIIAKRILYFLLGLFSLAIFLTSSRGGVYTMITLLLTLLVISVLLKKFSYKKILFVTMSILVGFTLSYLFLTNFNEQALKGKKNTAPATYTSQITETSLDKEDERAVSRRLAIEVLKNNKSAWILGIGPGQYGPVVQNNIERPDGGWNIVNNLTLELAVELGLIGLIAVLLFFASIALGLYSIIKSSKNNEIVIFSVIMLSYLVCQAVQYQSYSTLYIIIIWLVAGFSMALINNHKAKK